MGIDEIRAEMEKRGANYTQLKSKTLPMIMDILSESDTHIELWKAERRLEEVKHETEAEKKRCERYQRNLEAYKVEAKKWETDAREYIENFKKVLYRMETPEGRDALATAQIFIESIDIDTKYDNTAYINGLALILSQGNIGTATRIRKVGGNVPRKPEDYLFSV